MSKGRMLVTGATGMVGSFVARRAVDEGYQVRAMVRPSSDRTLLDGVDTEFFEGDLADYECFPAAVADMEYVVHCAAHIGSWGAVEKYRAVNVVSLEHLLAAVERAGQLRRWIHISTQSVYEARDHHGTDETVPPDTKGLNGYAQTKAEAEFVLRRHMNEYNLPAVILRPGHIYGPGERYVIPQLLRRFDSGLVRFIGDGSKVLNNTHIHEFVDAVFLALDNEAALNETFNIRDHRLVTREEYLMTIANYLGKPRPGRLPVWLVRAALPVSEGLAKLRGTVEAPLLTAATIKFMAMNLDYSIEKAKRILGYEGEADFEAGMIEALDWATGKSTLASTAAVS